MFAKENNVKFCFLCRSGWESYTNVKILLHLRETRIGLFTFKEGNVRIYSCVHMDMTEKNRRK